MDRARSPPRRGDVLAEETARHLLLYVANAKAGLIGRGQFQKNVTMYTATCRCETRAQL